MYEYLEEAKTLGKCNAMSYDLYRELSKAQNTIEGLSLAVVTNIALARHTWLIAHHPDTGYFMIDSTIGQFVYNKEAGAPYKDVFIGTYRDLEALHESDKYINIKGPVHLVWSPAICFDDNCPVKNKPLWNEYEFPVIDTPLEEIEGMERIARLGLWAARTEEAGVNWIPLLQHAYKEASKQEQWPDPEKPEQVQFFEDIKKRVKESRNGKIRLGKDKQGRSYQEMLAKDGYVNPPQR